MVFYRAKITVSMLHTTIRSLFVAFLLLLSCSVFAQRDSFTMTQLLPNNTLNRPWDIHFGPQGFLWVTERGAARITRINPLTGARDPLVTIPNVYADGRQDGLLGIALHDDLLGDSPYVYLSYTYRPGSTPLQRIVRYTFSFTGSNGTLAEPLVLIDSLPASNDHNSGRLLFGPDQKLYYTIGDQGGNQNRNYCDPILSQVLPTQAEVAQRDWRHYPGKVLRINTDGSIPDDNPTIAGVRSHVFSYGHRNAQGLVFGSNGRLYSDEHGPDTDDEVNLIAAGMNYGWPRVVGFQDDQAYDYCDWSSLANCGDLTYDKFNCPEGATFLEENTLTVANYQEPLFAMFAVTDDYDYNDPRCENTYMCRPNVAPSSLGIYESDVIPGWKNSLLVTSLKRGRVYRLQLDEAGTAIVGDTTELFYTQNRYRDITVSPDGRTFYLITDQEGNTSDPTGLLQRREMLNPGTILQFTYGTTTSLVNATTEPAPFRLWPNPASDHFQVALDLTGDVSGSVARAELIDISGRLVPLPNRWSNGLNRVDLTGLAAGVYSFRLSLGNKAWVERIVVR